MSTSTLEKTEPKIIGRETWNPDPKRWRRDYEETGYLVVENAVDAQLLGQMRDALEHIEREAAAGTTPAHLQRLLQFDSQRTSAHKHLRELNGKQNGAQSTLEAKENLSIIMELPYFAPVFQRLILYPRILDILETLFGTSEFAFHNYKCVSKMPKNNTPFQWHRDLPYLQHTTPDAITCMICLDDMTKENGATVVCPGSHRVALDDVKSADRDMPESEVPSNRVTVECPAGSAVLFHVNIVHGGGPNNSGSKRRNVIGIWRHEDCLPVRITRYAFEDVMPRSQKPARQKQIELSFRE